jgi:hypothetical protein
LSSLKSWVVVCATSPLSGKTYARIAEAKGKTSSGSDSSNAPAASSGPLGGSLSIADAELTKIYEGRPGRMDPSKAYSLLAQVNQSVSEVLWAFRKVINPLTCTWLLEEQVHSRHLFCPRWELKLTHKVRFSIALLNTSLTLPFSS